MFVFFSPVSFISFVLFSISSSSMFLFSGGERSRSGMRMDSRFYLCCFGVCVCVCVCLCLFVCDFKYVCVEAIVSLFLLRLGILFSVCTHDDDDNVGVGLGWVVDILPYIGTDRSATVQETKIFGETHVDVHRSIHIITKVLYILGQGDPLSVSEATTVYFNVTKLFQSTDVCVDLSLYSICFFISSSFFFFCFFSVLLFSF